jgi:hypothetical protein
MMKRIFMLLSLALMIGAAMALSGVAQAASPTAKCKAAAGLLPAPADSTSYKFIAGSDRKNDNFNSKNTQGKDVFCGFGGNDSIANLAADDIFIGGTGDDTVDYNYATFNGGLGNDTVWNNYATFNGDEGSDFVSSNQPGGTFNGGLDNDYVDSNYVGATVYGGLGGDQVVNNYGTFNGDAGDDYADYNYGTFNGGDGTDTVTYPDPADSPGTFNQDAL